MCLHTSRAFQVDEKSIVDISKNVLKTPGWKCDWGSTYISTVPGVVECGIVLASWNTYLQHLLMHCKCGKTNKHTCYLPRCNVSPDMAHFNSYEELAIHVKSSHMNRIPLVCPLSKCDTAVFSRSAALEAHFLEIHKDIIGLSISSCLLLPFWTPSLGNPQLRTHHLPSLCPAEALAGTCRGTGNQKVQGHGSTQVIQKHLKFPTKKLSNLEPSSNGEEPRTIVFVDLIKRADKQGRWIGDLRADGLIRRLNNGNIDMCKPQGPIACVYKLPPRTIHYEIFEERLDKVEGKD